VPGNQSEAVISEEVFGSTCHLGEIAVGLG